jgi:hypothetical protein
MLARAVFVSYFESIFKKNLFTSARGMGNTLLVAEQSPLSANQQKSESQQQGATMSKHFTAIKGLPLLAVLAVAVLIANLAHAQAPGGAGTAATGTPAPTEATPAVTPPTTPPTKPITINWKMHKLNGSVNITMNPDGSSDFSGGFKDKKPGDDWDISIAVKSNTGAIIVYHYEGDAANGVEFSKTGSSAFLADDFSSFASKHTWSGVYTFHLNAAGRRKHYEEMEAKRKKLHEEEEAAIRKHDKELLKEKKAEEKAEAKAEMQWEENYANQHPAGGSSSGGGGIASTVSSIGSTVNSVVNTVGGVVSDIGSMF